jgi:NCS1 family nucleobase:cation symporter-1
MSVPLTIRTPNSWTRRLQCPGDENPSYTNTLWCNRDLIPISPARHTWTYRDYATSWTLASSLLALCISSV